MNLNVVCLAQQVSSVTCLVNSGLLKSMLLIFQKFEKNIRMPKPDCCSGDIYQIMIDCWDSDPFIRKKPQATLRDLRQIWLQSKFYQKYFFFFFLSLI